MNLDWNPDSDQFANEFQKALETIGFVRLLNLWSKEEKPIMDQWFQTVEYWFNLPESQKEEYKISTTHRQGWVPKESSILNPYRKKDWKETYEFDDFSFSDIPPPFRPLIREVVDLIHNRSISIVRVLEKILGTEENYLVNLHDNLDQSHLRLCYYAKSEKREKQLPLSEHKDYTSLTLTFSPDPFKKLQIKDRTGTWNDIEYIDNSCAVQVGNIMQVLTQDYFKSAVHRVLWNEKADGFTTAYFLNLPPDYLMTHLGPNPKKYDDMTVAEFTEKFHLAKNQRHGNITTRNSR